MFIGLAIFLTGLVLSLVTSALTGAFTTADHWEYSDIAASLTRGDGSAYPYLGTTYYHYGPFLYPRLLAAVLGLTGGSHAAVLLLQAAVFGLSGVVVYHLARVFVDRGAAAAAGLLAASHPGNLVYSGKLHPHALDVVLVLIAFLLVCRLTLNPDWRKAALAGVAMGVAGLSRGTILAFAIAWALWFLMAERRRLPRAIGLVTITACCALVPLLPVVVSGYDRYGTLVPLRTDSGVNLWIGNNPRATGSLVAPDPSPRLMVDLMPPDLAARLRTLNEVEQNEVLSAAAWSFAMENPSQFARLFAAKLGHFWWLSPHAGRLYPPAWKHLYTGYYLLLVSAAVAGLVWLLAARRDYRAAGLVCLLFVSYSATQALFYVEGRHRWEVEAVMLIPAVAVAARAWSASQIQPFRQYCTMPPYS